MHKLAIAILKVLRKKGEKNAKKLRRTLKVHSYLSNGLADLAKILNWRCLNPRKFAQQNWLVFVRGIA